MKNKICSISIIGMMLFGIWETGREQQGTPCYAKSEDAVELTKPAQPQPEAAIRGSHDFENFEELEKNHKILAYDICSSPKYDYENTPLAEYIEADIVWNEEMEEIMGKQFPIEIDYHLFDFNGDGVKDYLLCEKGRLFDGREGNSVEIFIQEENGVRCVLSRVMRLHETSGHSEHAA